MHPVATPHAAALALLLTLFPLAGAHAQDAGAAAGAEPGSTCRAPEAGATCDGSGPASQAANGGIDLGAGNPINVVTGNKYQMEVDLPALPGELGLEIVRHYNSAARHVVGQLGTGWRLSYETDLYRVGQSVQILQADGRRLTFAVDPANPNQCAGSDPSQGWVEILGGSNGRGGYIWHWTHGTQAGRQLHFDARGKLVRIRAASGALLTLRRGPRGELLQVTDPQGRSLMVNHGGQPSAQRARGQGQAAIFTGITSMGSPLGRFEYRHGSGAEGDVTTDAIRAQAANLTEVRMPGVDGRSRSRHYHYEDTRHRQALTGISEQGAGSDGASVAQRIATYAYDEQGKAVLSERGAQRVRLQYLAPALPTREGATLLTNSLGEQTLYRHRIVGGEYRLTEAVGAGCAQCGPVNRHWQYDEQGRLTKQITLSPTVVQAGQLQGMPRPLQSTRHVVEANGLRVERIAYLGDQAQPSELVERQEYADPSWPDKPTRLIRPSVVPGKNHELLLSYNGAGQIAELTERGYSPINAEGDEEPTVIKRTTRYGYSRVNGRSVLTERDGPLPNGPNAEPSDSDITRYRWDGTGSFITSVSTPGGFATELIYDAVGRVVQATRDDRVRTHWHYDDRSRLTHLVQTGPGWGVPRVLGFKYDERGRLIEIGRGADASDSSRGPIAGLLTQAPPYTPLQARGYDAAGRLAWAASSVGVVQTLEYDSEGRITRSGRYSSAMAEVERWQYGPRGQVAAWSDNAGRHARIAYDEAGRPTGYRDSTGRRIELATATPAAPGRSAVTPDAVVPAPVQTMRDDFGRTVARSGGAHGRHVLTWDAADQLVAMQDALGNRASYRYDAAGRIVQQDVQPADAPESIQTHWHYDGRLLARIDYPTQSEHYRYDARGLLASRRVTLSAGDGQAPIGSVSHYLHDAEGRLAATSLPDGSWLHYERNGQDQVIALVRSPVQRSWLRRLAPEQAVASDLQRDLMGLKGYSAGNGVQSLWQRDATGALASIVHRRGGLVTVREGLQVRRSTPTRLGHSTPSLMERVLGITPAHAQSAARSASQDDESTPERAALPGALGLPAEPAAFFDERYLWSSGGLLLHSRRPRGNATQLRSQAYDDAGQLIAAVRARAQVGDAGMVPVSNDAADAREDQLWRYAYQGQRRVLAQETAHQSDTQGHTVRTAWNLSGQPSLQATTGYNANGQPIRAGNRHYRWDALGRLRAIEADGKLLARYRYDHRGLRIAKHTDQGSAHYLYSADRHLLAELDGRGRLQRQYVYLADMLLAVIDSGEPMASPDATVGEGQIRSLWQDLRALGVSYLRQFKAARITWVHSNHLGAPEAATDAKGNLVWQADYAPFGAARVRSAGPQSGPIQVSQRQSGPAFVLNIRLPGQYFDHESGLHYNRQRYYDPTRGAYLTPDPLGHPDGPNAYAYVANNPLSHVDPDGLVLFAFDGTQNGNPPKGQRTLSNVVSFQRAYLDGQWNYVAGVGADHLDPIYGDILAEDYYENVLLGAGKVPDQGGNYSGPARIERMMLYFADAAEAHDDEEVMDIDIVGFSRGAANARHFANLLVGMIDHGNVVRYSLHDNKGNLLKDENGNPVFGCQTVNFRFMGLFDTVLSTNRSKNVYQLGIPNQFQYVAQAVALNEYRSAPAGDDAYFMAPVNLGFWNNTRIHLDVDDHYGAFPLESIGVSSWAPGQVRIERGFIGAHADIGGGYSLQNGDNNHLSAVALSWMIGQAQIAGVEMDAGQAAINMGNSVYIHDQSNAIRFGNPDEAPDWWEVGEPMGATYSGAEDRQVRGGLGGGTQRMQIFGPAEAGGNRSMTNADTHQFITYRPRAEDIADDRRRTNDISGFEGVPVNAKPSNITGTVDMQGYISWLRSHGYALAGADQW